MSKKYKQTIIEKFSNGINKLCVMMRKLTACDEDILIKNAQSHNIKLQSIYDLQQQNLAESLSSDVAEKIRERIYSAIDPGFSELNMLVISDNPKALTKFLASAYKIMCAKLSKIPDDIDIKYKDKELNFKEIKAYTSFEIQRQNLINKEACQQLLDKIDINQATDESKRTLSI